MKPLTQRQKARIIFDTTPGYISDAVFERAGVKNYRTIWELGLRLKCGLWRRVG